jgi:hypothetical protein
MGDISVGVTVYDLYRPPEVAEKILERIRKEAKAAHGR